MSEEFSLIIVLFIVNIALFAYTQYLAGRLDKQSQLMGVMINAIKRLEGQVFKSGE
jgi:hypothetical protein